MTQFEASIDEPDSIDRARDVFEQAYKTLRTANDKEERLMLVEQWLNFEVKNSSLLRMKFHLYSLQREKGTTESAARVEKLFPTRRKQRRKILGEDGVSLLNVVNYSCLTQYSNLDSYRSMGRIYTIGLS